MTSKESKATHPVGDKKPMSSKMKVTTKTQLKVLLKGELVLHLLSLVFYIWRHQCPSSHALF